MLNPNDLMYNWRTPTQGAAAIGNMMGAMKQRRQQAMLSDLARQSIDPATGTVDMNRFVQALTARDPMLGMELQRQYAPKATDPLDAIKTQAEIGKINLESEAKKYEIRSKIGEEGLRLWQNTTGPEGWMRAVQFTTDNIDPDMGRTLAESGYNPDAVEMMISRMTKKVEDDKDFWRRLDREDRLAKEKRDETFRADKEERGFRDEFIKRKGVQTFDETSLAYDSMKAAWEASKKSEAAGKGPLLGGLDQTLITLFNKMLDPTSVVRESEYARTGQNMALMDMWLEKIKKIKKEGAGLDNEFRQQLLSVADSLYGAAENKMSEIVRQTASDAADYGFNPQRVVGKNFYQKYVSKAAKKPDSGSVKEVPTKPRASNAVKKVDVGGVGQVEIERVE
jgi:hypothetical protein